MTGTKSETKQSIRDWWAASPMTYGSMHGVTEYIQPDGTVEQVELGSKRFYELADETFIRWNTPRHGADGYFSNIFPYREMLGKNVLEVGCGMGFMASLWAGRGCAVTAIDLNPVAVQMTQRRFELFGLQGLIHEADGENLPFPDNSFDYAYSWGVLHHSPDTKKSVAELWRILKPGEKVGVMLYSRESFLARYLIKFQEGFINLEEKFLHEMELYSRYSDGNHDEGNWHTWPVTQEEVRQDLFSQYIELNVEVFGTDVGMSLWHWLPQRLYRLTPALWNALAKRWGWSFWITARKPL
jgi:ubiquinone/menaquinone biosynthesis C-methylase UbiE